MIKSPAARKKNNRGDEVSYPVYLEIEIGGVNKGKIEIELFDNLVPATAKNFRHLCKGFVISDDKGTQLLRYKGSQFHMVHQGVHALGGDFTMGNGTGGHFATQHRQDQFCPVTDPSSCFGKHDKPYLLTMSNHDVRLRIGSQFLITFTPLPQLDGHHVVFGKVVKGFEILREMQTVQTNAAGRPMVAIVISDSGLLIKSPLK